MVVTWWILAFLRSASPLIQPILCAHHQIGCIASLEGIKMSRTVSKQQFVIKYLCNTAISLKGTY